MANSSNKLKKSGPLDGGRFFIYIFYYDTATRLFTSDRAAY